MASLATTLLSTSKPTANINPTRDRMFSVIPIKNMTPSVAHSDNGTVAAITKLLRQRRINSSNVTRDKNPPKMPLSRRSESAVITPRAALSTGVTIISAKSASENAASSSSSTACATATKLASGFLKTDIPNESAPLTRRRSARS